MPNDDSIAVLPGPAVEAMRLQALRELQILDTPPEQAFDDLAWLAAQLCDAPMGLVSLVDADRQWFKARCGTDTEQTPRTVSFCAHAIESDALLEVTDARLDPRFADNPLVTGEPHVRFYAGAPLTGRDGHRFGTLRVVDTKPRTLDAVQREGLLRLARCTSDRLEARRQQLEAEARERTLTQLLEAMPNGVVTCDASGVLGEFNRIAREWHGVDPRALPPEEWAEHFGLFEPDGETPMRTEHIPLLRAWSGETVREAELVICANGRPPRTVLCSGEPLHAADGRLLGAVCVMHDITRLKQAQEQARLESTRFMDAFSSAAQGMALVGLDGRWLEVNDALCVMFGYGRAELLETDFQRLTHPEDLRKDLDLVTELLVGTRSRYQLDKRYFRKDGRTLWVHLSVSLVRDANGRPLHFVSQLQDVTHRHLADQRVRASEARLRSVLENSHDAFISIDDSGAIVEWNRAAETTFGWRRSEVLGKPMAEIIVPPRMRHAHCAGMARFLETDESRILDQRMTLPAWHRSGHEFPVEMTITVAREGRTRVFNAFLHDVSERLAAEEKLREGEARLRMVTDNMPALIAYVDRDLRYVFANRAYESWLNHPADWVHGRHMREVLGEARFQHAEPYVERVFAGERVEFERDYPLADGGVRHAHAIYIPDCRAGEVVGFYALIADITAHKQLQRVMHERAMTDALTGLPNRSAWMAELERGLARANRADTHAAVMFLDLNGFKRINDACGHATGDALLQEFARRLRTALRRNDFIARLAGDEFVVFLDQVNDPDLAPACVAGKLLEAMQPPMRLNGHTLLVTPSIGFAVDSRGVSGIEDIMKTADEAMYMAKRSGDAGFVVLEC